MIISTQDAKGLFTKKLVDSYQYKPKSTDFLRGFFKTTTAPTLEVSIEVNRGRDKVAVDVVRGTEGNRNTFSKTTESIIIPPYYREYFDVTSLQLYERMYGASEISSDMFAAYTNSVADKLMSLQEKIERAYELQCAQALVTGIVTLKSGVNIDFGRKSGSLVDLGAGNYFADANVNPYTAFAAGASFIKTTGRSNGGVYNAILGETALANFFANAKFLENQNLYNMSFDAVQGPARDNNSGADYYGTITAGAYKIQLWGYNATYLNESNVDTQYIDPKKVVMFPVNPNFTMAFAAVPQLISPNTAPKVGAFVFDDYIDERHATHIYDVKSAGIAIPTAVDTTYTFKAVA